MSDGMGREFAYLSSHATNRYFIPNWGKVLFNKAKASSKKTKEGLTASRTRPVQTKATRQQRKSL